ncbi:Hypothetical protein CINCED_3A010117 [Cinara cedri]|uniref:Transcription factor CBF/NF-Y/archaeal histone domain,Histone-fold n=1 Tax=Cinara cedri TaxID=506608 RepID=A0A5E4N7N8_9HEMI|nr:Transcription factor CBF/NF-Y/archaeal histone domain,Histone-fold [Cinara cedri]VVC40761.1 Hypothetical protein CINCED_3A010117 [Cinara cedri]
MENDSPNLFDSEPVSVQLTVVDNETDVLDDIVRTEDRPPSNVEDSNVVDGGYDEVQDHIEYQTDESDVDNEHNDLTAKDQLAEDVDKSDDDSAKNKTAKDVHHKGLPPGRVKLIMKMDPDVNIVAGEAVFLVTKATESFIGLLAQHCHKAMVTSNKKTLQKKHIDAVIEDNVPFEFLEGALDW